MLEYEIIARLRVVSIVDSNVGALCVLNYSLRIYAPVPVCICVFVLASDFQAIPTFLSIMYNNPVILYYCTYPPSFLLLLTIVFILYLLPLLPSKLL